MVFLSQNRYYISILLKTSRVYCSKRRDHNGSFQSQHILHGCTRKFTSNSYFLHIFLFVKTNILSCGLKSILSFQLDNYDYPHKYQWFNPCWLLTNEKIYNYDYPHKCQWFNPCWLLTNEKIYNYDYPHKCQWFNPCWLLTNEQIYNYDYPHKCQWFNPCWLLTNEKIYNYDYPHKYQWFNPCWLLTNEKN